MAYLLRFNPSGTDDRVDVPATLDFTDITFEWTGLFSELAGADRGLFQRWSGTADGITRLVCWYDEPNGLQFIIQKTGGSQVTTTGITGLSIDTAYKISVRVRNGNRVEVFVDDVLERTVTTTETFNSVPAFSIGDNPSGLTRPFLGDLYLFKVLGNSGTPITLDPSASNGTGATLPDTAGTNDGTLVNFPTDDSQWVFYDDGGAVTGTGSPQAQTATASGTGERVVTGSGTPTAQTATASGTGERTITGSGTPQAATATTSGTGTTAGNVTGTGAVAAQRATAAGVGLRVITGTGSPNAQASTTTGTGSVSGAVSGTGSVNAQPATASGTGARIVTGSGTAQATEAAASGTGEVAGAISGTGAVQAQRATATGVGLRVITGQGTGQAQRATASGTGSVQGAITGTGTAQAQRATATGVGLRVITGTGSVQAQAATVEGSDRGALARPVIKPGSLDIQPKYGTTDY